MTDKFEDHMVQLLSLQQVARQLGLSIHTVRAWARSGKLPCIQMGRRVMVVKSDLEGFVESNRKKSE